MSRPVKRITFITDAPHFGGAERYVIDMCAAAARRSVLPHVHWLRPSGAPSDLFEAVRNNGAQLSQQIDRSLQRVLHQLRSFRPDAVIINACGRPRMWQIAWLCRFLGIPCCWVHHMVDASDPRGLAPARFGGRMQGLSAWRWPQALRHRLAAISATAVLASNPSDAEHLVRWSMAPRTKLHVLSPGIEPASWAFQSGKRASLRANWLGCDQDETFVVGTAARLVDGKGIETLLKAIEELKGSAPVLLVVAGAGPRESQLRTTIEQRGLQSCVRLLGHVDDMAGFYSALDLFALCSQTESFGLAIAEAMACERAVLATPAHGALRQIRHGETGWLAAGFSHREVFHAIQALLRTPALRAELGRNARQHVLAEFSIDRTFDETLRLLTRVRRWPLVQVEASTIAAVCPAEVSP